MPRSRYPVDRYLVESSKKLERENTNDDDLWTSEPALKPEDEIMLRKLHDMLQSTTNDLKILSGELSKFQEPSIQIKSSPIPLDEEFNEKVHIEELVNAKFYGHKLVDKNRDGSGARQIKNVIGPSTGTTNADTKKKHNVKPKVSTSVQVNTIPEIKQKRINRNMGFSKTKLIQISDKTYNKKLNNGKIIKEPLSVAYNEFCYKHEEPTSNIQKNLQLQKMPNINIRSELKLEKVFNLSILPENNETFPVPTNKGNSTVILVKHIDLNKQPIDQSHSTQPKPLIRKVSKMSTCESSESSNNLNLEVKTKLRKHPINISPKSTNRVIQTHKKTVKRDSEKRCYADLEEWKRKLNRVYGGHVFKNDKPSSKYKINKKKASPDKKNVTKPILNNTEYIPYSRLTLGGVRVSDIEKEIGDISNKNVPLSPIIDRILSSRDNSPRKNKQEIISRTFTTSDENLMQEVVDIERTISETLSKTIQKDEDNGVKPKTVNEDSVSYKSDSYIDDFEDDTDQKEQILEESYNNIEHLEAKDTSGNKLNSNNYQPNNEDNISDHNKPSTSKIQNRTYIKASNLSFKDSVDVFEFVHNVDTQDTGTQSDSSNKIIPKETQTSPTNERQNLQPIRNDLWMSIDPRKEVEKMLELEKDFIKKFIIEEYGDILEEKITKPSTSKDRNENIRKNIAASQKNTQTSPARVKSVMTSPRRTKTRTTSPFPLSLAVDKQTSPLLFDVNNRETSVDLENDELGISINLSSPRFNLRLPQTTREVLSNLDACTKRTGTDVTSKTFRKTLVSSSSADADNSSSELSSVGEIKMNLKKKIRALNRSISSESSSSSVSTKYSSDLQPGGILPLKSDGELSLGRSKDKRAHSIGETSNLF